jgi:hypothetical protein
VPQDRPRAGWLTTERKTVPYVWVHPAEERAMLGLGRAGEIFAEAAKVYREFKDEKVESDLAQRE